MKTITLMEDGVLVEKTTFSEREKEILLLMKNQSLDFVELKYGSENPLSVKGGVVYSEINELLVRGFVQEDPDEYHLYILTDKGEMVSNHL